MFLQTVANPTIKKLLWKCSLVFVPKHPGKWIIIGLSSPLGTSSNLKSSALQALWCDVMFCVTWTDPAASYPLRMGGGTKWAAQVYVNRFEPLGVEPADACRLWLYDVNQAAWQRWDCRTQSWTLAEPPMLTAKLKFAGIGTRTPPTHAAWVWLVGDFWVFPMEIHQRWDI